LEYEKKNLFRFMKREREIEKICSIKGAGLDMLVSPEAR
jgi:hypothetical protein